MSQRLRATPWFRSEDDEARARKVRRVNIMFPRPVFEFARFLEYMNVPYTNTMICPVCKSTLEMCGGKLFSV